jgi:hypothetical protein
MKYQRGAIKKGEASCQRAWKGIKEKKEAK